MLLNSQVLELKQSKLVPCTSCSPVLSSWKSIVLTVSAKENILENVFGLSVFVFYELSGNIESRKKVLITDGDPSCKTSEIHCNVCIFQGTRQQRPGPVIHVISGGGSFGGWKWGVCVCVCVCARSVVSDSLRPHGL